MVNNSNTYHVATQLVRQVHRTIKKHDAADVARDETACRILAGRVNTLADEASWHAAGSPEAALLFASVLAGDLEGMGEGEHADDARLERMHRMAIALVHYVERTSGIGRDEFRLDWFAPQHFDASPFGETAKAYAA